MLKHGTRRKSILNRPSWQQRAKGTYDEYEQHNFDRTKFIWDAPETDEFLSYETIEELTEHIYLVLDKVETEREFKYL